MPPPPAIVIRIGPPIARAAARARLARVRGWAASA